MQTYEAGTKELTLNKLIKFNPRIFRIKPGKKQLVRFTITAPDDIKKERRGIVFFEQDTAYVEMQTGAQVKTQIGSAIYFVPTTAQYNFRLKGFRIRDFDDESPQIGMFLFENAGDAHVRYIINYKVINDKGILVEKSNLQEKVILPGYERVLLYNFQNKLSPGNYKLLLNINFKSTDKCANYNIPFEIK